MVGIGTPLRAWFVAKLSSGRQPLNFTLVIGVIVVVEQGKGNVEWFASLAHLIGPVGALGHALPANGLYLNAASSIPCSRPGNVRKDAVLSNGIGGCSCKRLRELAVDKCFGNRNVTGLKRRIHGIVGTIATLSTHCVRRLRFATQQDHTQI